MLAWQAENRASFILDKLAEGYDNDDLRDELGFSLSDIQKARQTRAIADMARSIDLPDEVKAKLDNPRAKLFTTLERVFDSSVGRDFLKVEPNAHDGLRGKTTKKEFIRGFIRLVRDVALGTETSRTLNTNEDIRKYFMSWRPAERPQSKRGSFVPSDIIKGRSVASPARKPSAPAPRKSKQVSRTVLPKDFKVRFGNDRLIDIHRELTKLKREEFPNAGAVLLRVFFELAATHFLGRVGELARIIDKLKTAGKLRFGHLTMQELVKQIKRVAKGRLDDPEYEKVCRALSKDPDVAFRMVDLHAFVHSSDLPGERDIRQFWLRTEPLFRMMLEQDAQGAKE